MSKKSTPIVLGIDPGYGRLGLAVVESADGKETIKIFETLETSKNSSPAERLAQIGQRVEQVIKDYQPTIIALERLFFTANQKTALQVAEARGVIVYLAGKHNLALAEHTPLEVKQTITGWGRADKQQVARVVARLITLPHPPKFDDELDAVAVALTALAKLRARGH